MKNEKDPLEQLLPEMFGNKVSFGNVTNENLDNDFENEGIGYSINGLRGWWEYEDPKTRQLVKLAKDAMDTLENYITYGEKV